MQQIQVLPVQSAQGGQQIIMQPNPSTTGQAQTAQVIQTADGQTLIYQPVQVSKLAKYRTIRPFLIVIF